MYTLLLLFGPFGNLLGSLSNFWFHLLWPKTRSWTEREVILSSRGERDHPMESSLKLFFPWKAVSQYLKMLFRRTVRAAASKMVSGAEDMPSAPGRTPPAYTWRQWFHQHSPDCWVKVSGGGGKEERHYMGLVSGKSHSNFPRREILKFQVMQCLSPKCVSPLPPPTRCFTSVRLCSHLHPDLHCLLCRLHTTTKPMRCGQSESRWAAGRKYMADFEH